MIEYWHNPRCSKSRAGLALLQERGAEVTVRRYLDDAPSADEIAAVRAAHPALPVECEVESLDELDQAIAAGADMVLLDNFGDADLAVAVKRARGRLKTEISGGVELDQLAALGRIGADFISVGALTKHVRATDFSLRMHD